MSFYERFIELCKRENMSPSKVAEEIGLSNSIITYWKTGAMPKTETLKKIANHFNVTFEYIATGAGVLGDAPPEQYKKLAEGFASLTNQPEITDKKIENNYSDINARLLMSHIFYKEYIENKGIDEKLKEEIKSCLAKIFKNNKGLITDTADKVKGILSNNDANVVLPILKLSFSDLFDGNVLHD